MINLNSPTVQAMLNNTPNGIGNMPSYMGDNPSIQSQQFSTPYPSPKEMLIQGGQSNIYTNVPFNQGNNIVGGYNAAFNGYSNPYMSNYNYTPLDQDSIITLEAANNNGLTYEEQVMFESDLYKTMSRIVSKNLGRDDEESLECEKTFDIYSKDKNNKNTYYLKEVKPIHIQLKVNGEIIADMKPEDNAVISNNHIIDSSYMNYVKAQKEYQKDEMIRRNNEIYNKAPERLCDNMTLYEFLNNGGAGLVMSDMLQKDLYYQNISRAGDAYDKENFRKRLLENNGIRSKSNMKALERFAGRYGVMPNGNPVTPGLNPSIGSSFSYDPGSGQYSVTAPNFIRDRLERARESFIRSID